MRKLKINLLGAFLAIISSSHALAAETVEFNFETLDQVLPKISQKSSVKRSLAASVEVADAYQRTGSHYSPQTKKTITNYQQYYQGIEVLGAKLTVQSAGQMGNVATRSLREQPATSLVKGSFINKLFFDQQLIAKLNAEDKRQAVLKQITEQYQQRNPAAKINAIKNKLVIGVVDGEAKLLYQPSFYMTVGKQKRLINLIVAADNPEHTLKMWDNLQRASSYYPEVGFGGTSKTGRYKYGEDGLPPLMMDKTKDTCIMRNDDIKVVNALEDVLNPNYTKAFRRQCGKNSKDKKVYCTKKPQWLEMFAATDALKQTLESEEAVDQWLAENSQQLDYNSLNLLRGWFNDERTLAEYSDQEVCVTAYSPANDAFYFGQVVIDVFKDWYQSPVIAEGSRLTLVTHIVDPDLYSSTGEQTYNNAYFNPDLNIMAFGDGEKDEYYPFVSLNITGHEVAHGYTEQYSRLTYVDQTGSLNESFSDMAGLITMAYLQETQPALYQAIYHSDELDWNIGADIKVVPWDFYDTAYDESMKFIFPLRFLDQPSQDEKSADCFNQVSGCNVTYQQMHDGAYNIAGQQADFIAFICENFSEDPDFKDLCEDFNAEEYTELLAQSIIVHSGSGVFNKAFYLLSNFKPDWDIKKAFEIMLVSNRDGYWQDRGPFNQDGFLEEAACGTVKAANDIGYNAEDVKDVFQQVGLLLDNQCLFEG